MNLKLKEVLSSETSKITCHHGMISKNILLFINTNLCFLSIFGATAPSGSGPPHSQGF
jgi:hypothetical protein